jgi:hypothetical protein
MLSAPATGSTLVPAQQAATCSGLQTSTLGTAIIAPAGPH